MRKFGMALALALTTVSAQAHSFTNNGENCTANNFHWDGEEAVVERQTIEAGALRSLKASVDHAPVSVIGGNASGYTIEVCKAATNAADLRAIRVSVEGGELRSSGPDNRRWHVQYRIRVPRNANIDVATTNGPLSLRDVDGTVVARAKNGPLSLKNLSGEVDATTTNGPISISGGSGNIRMQATNGPLSVNLNGDSWRGGTLTASTKNGPLSLNIPRGYGSGVVVESNGRGPLRCRAEGCERARAYRDDDDARGWRDETPRRIELGRGAEAVRISTVNGPITIEDE